MAQFKDKFGKEIKVGDFIIYSTRQSSSLYVYVAKVKTLSMRPRRWSSGEEVPWIYAVRPNTYSWSKSKISRCKISNINKVIVVPAEVLDAETIRQLSLL